MNDNIHDIHYCVNLSSEQWRYLINEKSSINRHKCLYHLMEKAVLTKTSYRIKGIEIELEVGQVAASDVETAEYMECNRKTIGKFIDSLNRLGMVTTMSNNRTSIHTLHFLACWYVDGVMVANPHYTKLSANAGGLTGNVRTPYPKEGQSEKGQPVTSPVSPRDGRDVGSKGGVDKPVSFPLLSNSNHPLPESRTDGKIPSPSGNPPMRTEPCNTYVGEKEKSMPYNPCVKEEGTEGSGKTDKATDGI